MSQWTPASDPRRYVELGRLITEIARADEEAEIYRAVSRHLAAIVANERASVAVVLPGGTHVAIHALEGPDAVRANEPLPLDSVSVRLAIERREIVEMHPCTDSPYVDLRLLAGAGVRRGLIAPLIGRDTVHGTITIGRAVDEPYCDDDLILMSQVADLVSTTLERVQLVAEMRETAHSAEVYAMRLESLNEISHELAGALTEDAVFDVVADAVPWTVTCDRVSYAVVQPDGEHVRIGALSGEAGRATAGSLLPMHGTVIGQVIAAATPTYVPDAAKHDEASDARLIADLGMRSLICLPVTVAGVTEASLNVASSEVDRYGAQERGTLTTLARLMGSTIERVRATELLEHRARHDELTGLPNRREFGRALGEALGRVATSGTRSSLCYVDVDQFKTVNDSYGHAAGDALLVEVAAELCSGLSRRDLVGRLGGDEFALLLDGCPLADALGVAERLRRHVADSTFVYEGHLLATSLSIGVVELAPAMTSTRALREADAACYEAKKGGRNRVAVARPGDDLGLSLQHEADCVRAIKAALRDNRFELHAQPIVALSDAGPDGPVREVLVRMRDVDGQLVMPGAFIDIAERYGLIAEIDRWVIRNAMAWIAGPGAPARGICTVNVSGESVGSPAFLNDVLDILRTTTAPTDRLCFEITETAAIRQAAQALRFMSALSALGCRFALDDFGSGFSSFSALKALPVDYLKIDGELVRDIVVDPVDRAVVHAIQALADALDVAAIAEFVEDDETRATLTDMGIAYGQGYALGRPAPITAAALH